MAKSEVELKNYFQARKEASNSPGRTSSSSNHKIYVFLYFFCVILYLPGSKDPVESKSYAETPLPPPRRYIFNTRHKVKVTKK
jgi:hypothetical protein